MSGVQQSLGRRRGVSLSLDLTQSSSALQRRGSTISLPNMNDHDERYRNLSPVSKVAVRLGYIGNAIDSELSDSSLSLSLSMSTERRPSVASSVASTIAQSIGTSLTRRMRRSLSNWWRRVVHLVIPAVTLM